MGDEAEFWASVWAVLDMTYEGWREEWEGEMEVGAERMIDGQSMSLIGRREDCAGTSIEHWEGMEEAVLRVMDDTGCCAGQISGSPEVIAREFNRSASTDDDMPDRVIKHDVALGCGHSPAERGAKEVFCPLLDCDRWRCGLDGRDAADMNYLGWDDDPVMPAPDWCPLRKGRVIVEGAE